MLLLQPEGVSRINCCVVPMATGVTAAHDTGQGQQSSALGPRDGNATYITKPKKRGGNRTRARKRRVNKVQIKATEQIQRKDRL